MAEALEKRFAELEKAKERPKISRPKIQRVASYLRNREHFAKHYSPKLVSMGAIHHGDPNLQLGEQCKLMWAAMYIESTKHTPQILHKRIADNIKELKGLFATDVFTNLNYTSEGFISLEEKLSWMLFVDGCSLLQILEHKLDEPEEMKVKLDQMALVMQDVLLLENQLPYQVLKLLWRDNNESELKETMKNFLHCHHWAPDSFAQKHQGMRKRNNNEEEEESSESTVADVSQDESSIHPDKKEEELRCTVVDVPKDESESHTPTHLLDLQRTIILTVSHPKIVYKEASKEKQNSNGDNNMVTYRNIQELRAAGITLKSSKTRRPRDVSFSDGWFAAELTLPEIVVDDTTATTILNQIAYEMCPDFKNDYGICSFVAFMDSLIDHPEDVKALRSQGILLNSLGSDEEVAMLFNIISSDLVPDSLAYYHVRTQIDKHYKNRCKNWIALGIRTYFNNPWVIIAFHAAVIALALTFVQTWFAIYPTKS